MHSYFKRFRMEIDLRPRMLETAELPPGYKWLAWDQSLIVRHAKVKTMCFADEVDSVVFSSLSNFAGCNRLMRDICERTNFLPETTWLIARHISEPFVPYPSQHLARNGDNGVLVDCGTIQGVRHSDELGAIQNVGIIPNSRRLGLGRALVLKSLTGFLEAGCDRVFLEVTAENSRAVKLYQSLGFRIVRTTYRVVESRQPLKVPQNATLV